MARRLPPRQCAYDPFGDTFPRTEGTIAKLTGRGEPTDMLRRILRRCYEDWLTLSEARAYHMTVRLYEQLTGIYDDDAAMSAVSHREYASIYVTDRREIGPAVEDKKRNRWDF